MGYSDWLVSGVAHLSLESLGKSVAGHCTTKISQSSGDGAPQGITGVTNRKKAAQPPGRNATIAPYHRTGSLCILSFFIFEACAFAPSSSHSIHSVFLSALPGVLSSMLSTGRGGVQGTLQLLLLPKLPLEDSGLMAFSYSVDSLSRSIETPLQKGLSDPVKYCRLELAGGSCY